jgi:hypothetical protein
MASPGKRLGLIDTMLLRVAPPSLESVVDTTNSLNGLQSYWQLTLEFDRYVVKKHPNAVGARNHAEETHRGEDSDVTRLYFIGHWWSCSTNATKRCMSLTRKEGG